MYVYVPCECLMSAEDRRGCHICWDLQTNLQMDVRFSMSAGNSTLVLSAKVTHPLNC